MQHCNRCNTVVCGQPLLLLLSLRHHMACGDDVLPLVGVLVLVPATHSRYTRDEGHHNEGMGIGICSCPAWHVCVCWMEHFVLCRQLAIDQSKIAVTMEKDDSITHFKIALAISGHLTES